MENQADRNLLGKLNRFFAATIPAGETCPKGLLRKSCLRLSKEIDALRDEQRPIKMPIYLARAHAKAIREKRTSFKDRIRDTLGALARRFSAQYASLYVPFGSTIWRAKYSFRLDQSNRDICIRQRSVVGDVIETLTPCVAEVVVNTRTDSGKGLKIRSQMAAPVILSGPGISKSCLGVVCLASKTNKAFKNEQAEELLQESKELAVLLMCADALESGDYSKWPFDPYSDGWCVEGILKHVCEKFTQGICADVGNAHLSTTIWHTDWHLQEMLARTTAGYSVAYTRASLPLDNSFTGRVVRMSPAGTVSHAGPDHPLFYAKVNGKGIGLTDMSCCPIVSPSGSAQAMGAVNVYDFSGRRTRRVPNDKVIQEFSQIIGGLIVNFERQRLLAASMHLAWQMERSARMADKDELVSAQFHVLKDSLHNYFGANGCSLFVPDESRQVLTIAASTGTRGERYECKEGLWVRVATAPSCYNLMENGLVQYLYRRPGKALVLNDVLKLDRLRGAVDPELPQRINGQCLEHLTPDTTGRRFLGIGIRMFGANWMVVRLTRTMEQPPFTRFDGALLEHIATLCQSHNLWIPAEQPPCGQCIRARAGDDCHQAPEAAGLKAARPGEAEDWAEASAFNVS